MKKVIPLAPEFIRNTDGTDKQDCEINAGKQIIIKIRKAHRQLKMIIVADSLYSKQPFIEDPKEQRFSFILSTASLSTAKSLIHYGWVTDIPIDRTNIVQLVKAGRARRYKIMSEEGLKRLGARKEECVEIAGFAQCEDDITRRPLIPGHHGQGGPGGPGIGRGKKGGDRGPGAPRLFHNHRPDRPGVRQLRREG